MGALPITAAALGLGFMRGFDASDPLVIAVRVALVYGLAVLVLIVLPIIVVLIGRTVSKP
jgi:hypothetical protein